MKRDDKSKIPTHLLSLAGEYRVCSELIKRGVFATVTYGNYKGVDVYAISNRQERALRIEVKTSQRNGFVTGISQKGTRRDDPTAPDFWVLFQLRSDGRDTFSERFFILSHQEIYDTQLVVNNRYAEKYLANHGHSPDASKGVDSVRVGDVEQHENQWSKIINRFRQGRT